VGSRSCCSSATRTRVVGNADYTRLSIGVLALLVGISYAFAGTVGIGVFVVAGALGLVPPRVGARDGCT